VVADNRYLADEDPQLKQRGYFVELAHPEVGVKQHCGIPWKMSRTECAVRAPAPCIGQHTDEVLADLLGYSKDEITRLRDQGALE
jgi:crotonobetainyl-CoA:carnitine CoA-transferase CaiB-like acyl-CoA transferase